MAVNCDMKCDEKGVFISLRNLGNQGEAKEEKLYMAGGGLHHLFWEWKYNFSYCEDMSINKLNLNDTYHYHSFIVS